MSILDPYIILERYASRDGWIRPYTCVYRDVREELTRIAAVHARLRGESDPCAADDLGMAIGNVEADLDEMENANRTAGATPGRFGIDRSSLAEREAFVNAARGQLHAIKRDIRRWAREARDRAVQEAREEVPPRPDPVLDQQMQQAVVFEQQDADLENLGKTVDRIGQIGRSIGDELEGQERYAPGMSRDRA